MAHFQVGGEHPRLAAVGRGISQAFWAIAAGIIVAYVFFLALGAFGLGEVVAMTVGVIVLSALWVLHGVQAARRRGHDPELTHARERRGF